MLRESFDIDGVDSSDYSRNGGPIPNTKSIQDMLLAELKNVLARANTNVVNGTSTLGSSQWKTWDWNDNILAHFVPKGWTFPDKIPL